MKRILLCTFILFLFLFPSVNATAEKIVRPKGFFNWGFIVYQRYNLTSYECGFGPMEDPYRWWSICFDVSYHVIGFGRHTIRVEKDENYSYYYLDPQTQEPDFNKTMYYNRSGVAFEEHIWMFDFYRGPHVKPRAILTIETPVNLGITGTVQARVYIDDVLAWNDTIYAEHLM